MASLDINFGGGSELAALELRTSPPHVLLTTQASRGDGDRASPDVGFLGLGIMGQPMALNLAVAARR